MADVFVSYQRDERPVVERIAEELRLLGLTVWFDASLSAGESFGDEIDREVRAAKAVLVCWSPAARQSRWVKAEAMIGFEQDRLAACYVAGPDKFSPPTPFNASHTEDLRAWFREPDTNFANWRSVLRRIGKLSTRADIEFTAAIRLNPQDAGAFKERGLAHADQCDYAGAIADLTEAIRLNPLDAEAFFYRGEIRENLPDAAGALADYTEAIRLDPQCVDALIMRAVLHCSPETYTLAIADYTEAIRVEPNAWTFNSRASVHCELGDYDRAIADYTEAIQLDPNEALHFENRAQAYRALGDTASAEADDQHARRLLRTRG